MILIADGLYCIKIRHAPLLRVFWCSCSLKLADDDDAVFQQVNYNIKTTVQLIHKVVKNKSLKFQAATDTPKFVEISLLHNYKCLL